MKPSLQFIALLICSCFVFNSYGQKIISEGILQYKISIESTKSENEMVNSLNGAELTLYLKPTVSRSEMKSTLGMESTVFNIRNGAGFILKEYSGQKLMISMNEENWSQKNRLYENMNFTLANEMFSIAGYQCKKATAILADGKVFTVYFDPSLLISNKKYNNAFFNLPGLPVQYELQSGNLNFKYILSRINYDAVPQSKFEAPKTGFRIMTYEENQQLKKGNN